ncbi:MAG: CHRD domain-containing protein [Methylococcaceae bacterium]|nr:CHRD domain-containing protein [Methylococcaceae bacterium]
MCPRFVLGFSLMIFAGVLPEQAISAELQVEVENFDFRPPILKVKPGDTVTWVWRSGSHSVTATSGSPESWDSGIHSETGFSYSRKFSSIGQFPYLCSVHGPSMSGQINVADPDSPVGKLDNPIKRSIPTGDISVKLTQIVAPGALNSPVWGTAAPGDVAGRLFIADQTGILWMMNPDGSQRTQFGDFSSLLVSLGIAGAGSYDERGLLGFAFHPAYRDNGLIYTYTSEPVNGAADFSTMPAGFAANHQSVIREWKVGNPGDAASVVDTSAAHSRVLLRIDEPQFNHNGGALEFGPDGRLYIALGDGGEADDQGDGHNPRKGNGQDRTTVLGKFLRIDPDARTAPKGQYGIPGDNPFLPRKAGTLGGTAGCSDGICDEIFAWGLRNPFRFSFDPATGALYAGDVGQNSVEEIDVIKAGGNYGWRRKEGKFCFRPFGDKNGYVTASSACASAKLVNPIAQYDHDEGTAVIGGFVYRGTAIPALVGHYVFGDYSRTVNSNPTKARLFYLVRGELVRGKRLRSSSIAELNLSTPLADSTYLLGFARDAQGELYALTNTSGVPSGATGAVWKIEAP